MSFFLWPRGPLSEVNWPVMFMVLGKTKCAKVKLVCCRVIFFPHFLNFFRDDDYITLGGNAAILPHTQVLLAIVFKTKTRILISLIMTRI